MYVLDGIPVSPGYGTGPAFVYRGAEGLVIAAERARGEVPEIERRRFEDGLTATRRELRALQQRLTEEYGADEGHIVAAQFLILDDPLLVEGVRRRLRTEGTAAETAVAATARELEQQFATMPDPYLRERSADVRDVGLRILRQLADRAHHPLAQLPAGVVVVAERLLPSDTVFLDRAHVGAMVTERGSDNSHAAILARALAIPAVTQVGGILTVCRDGDPVAVDGVAGRVIVRPEGRPEDEYRRRARRYHASVDQLRRGSNGAVTRDGVAIRCMANINRLGDLDALRASGAEGVGLLRTEFLLLDEGRAASEDEQTEAYRRIAQAAAGRPVVIRTLDLAPDKLVPLADDLPLAHASVGERGIHYGLAHPEILRPQLRAILRASAHGDLRILLPMVTGVAEIECVRVLLAEIAEALRAEGAPIDETIPVGAMIETPPAVLMVRDIVEAADFVSIGSNDLLQYLFAADRQFRSDQHASEYEPSLLRAIDTTVRAGREAGKEVGLCGEMAGTPALTVVLIGLGLRVLSMSPQRLAEVRYNVRESDSEKARALAEEVLRQRTADEVRRVVLAHADPWRRVLEDIERQA
jgi:phosphotransferase system enzyme I (PtsI)